MLDMNTLHKSKEGFAFMRKTYKRMDVTVYSISMRNTYGRMQFIEFFKKFVYNKGRYLSPKSHVSTADIRKKLYNNDNCNALAFVTRLLIG